MVEADVGGPGQMGAAKALVDPLEILDQHAGQVTAEPVSNHDPQDGHMVERGGHGVGGDEPAPNP